jgi:hypothetical protein
MMRLIPLVLLFFVSGCSLMTPVMSPKFPAAPSELLEEMPALSPLPAGKKSPRELLDSVAENFGVCHQYLERAHAWEDWYHQQKTLHEQYRK